MENKYREALERINSIDLDYVLENYGYEDACGVSVYGIHDYPNLEMSGDIETLNQAISKAEKYDEKETPLKVVVSEETGYYDVGDDCRSFTYNNYHCPKCNSLLYTEGDEDALLLYENANYCPNCSQKLDWS